MINIRMTVPLSIIISILLLISSIFGLFGNIYREAPAWLVQAYAADIMNLACIPFLLVSLLLAIKGSRRGFFVFSGILLYLIYTFLLYTFAMHFNRMFLVYVGILGTSFYCLAGIIYSLDMKNLQEWFKESQSFNAAVWFLCIMAGLFAILWLSSILPAVINGSIPAEIEGLGLPVNPVHVIDLALLLPAFIISSVLVKKKAALGYFLTPSMLVFSALMSAAIAEIMIVTAYLKMPADPAVTVVMLGLSAISAIVFLMETRKI